MKILRILASGPYGNHAYKCLPAFFREHSYAKTLELLRDQGFLYPSRFYSFFSERGHQIEEVVANFPKLQAIWGKENGIKKPLSSHADQVRFLFEQIKVLKPEIIYFERGSAIDFLSNKEKGELKSLFPFIKIITGVCGSDSLPAENLKAFDVIFSMDTLFHKRFTDAGLLSKILYHCFDPLKIPSVKHPTNLDFIFAGVSSYGFPDHKNRYLLLHSLMHATCLKLWVYEETSLTNQKAKIRKKLVQLLSLYPFKKPTFLKENTLTRLLRDAKIFKEKKTYIREKRMDPWFTDKKPLKKLFPTKVYEPLFGPNYYRLLCDAKVILNAHTDSSGHFANMRTFEATGLGKCLLTDRGELMKDLFTIDEEIVSYSSSEECIEKVSFLLKNPALCKEIGMKASQRVQKEHLFKYRGELIETTLKQLLRR